MQDHDKFKAFDMHQVIKLLDGYEKWSTIIVTDLKSKLPLITSKDPLERDLVGYDIFGDMEANEMVHILDFSSILIYMGDFEPLNRPLNPSHKPSLEKTLN